MEFWKIYRIVKSRRWMILGLLLITLATVYVAKKAVDEQTQYVAGALVLPSFEAMSPGGLYPDSTKTSVLTPTYDRFSRMAQFLQEIKGRFPDAVQLASESAVTRSGPSSRPWPAGCRRPRPRPRWPRTRRNSTLDLILAKAHVPTDDAIWTPRTFSDAAQQQMREGLVAAPYVDSTINTTPGARTPRPSSRTTSDRHARLRPQRGDADDEPRRRRVHQRLQGGGH